jgi:hypothetical protein
MVVSADIEPADVIAPDDEDIGLVRHEKVPFESDARFEGRSGCS